MRSYWMANKEKLKDRNLKKYHGIGVDEFNAMMDKQSGLCAICNGPERSRDPKTKQTRNLAVDHCHKTGLVRGLLCTDCNTALGGFKDDTGRLKAAIDYLDRAGF